MIYFLFVIFIVIASLLMIGIVLIQESKGGGLASNFYSSNAIMGVRKTTDFIEKATWSRHCYGILQHRMRLCCSGFFYRKQRYGEGSY